MWPGSLDRNLRLMNSCAIFGPPDISQPKIDEKEAVGVITYMDDNFSTFDFICTDVLLTKYLKFRVKSRKLVRGLNFEEITFVIYKCTEVDATPTTSVTFVSVLNMFLGRH